MTFPRQVLVAHRDDRRPAFVEADGDVARRDPQNEYCEWHVTRNVAGKITKVVFVTESPEYWQHLWAADPSTVVTLYQSLVDPAVSEAVDHRQLVVVDLDRLGGVDGVLTSVGHDHGHDLAHVPDPVPGHRPVVGDARVGGRLAGVGAAGHRPCRVPGRRPLRGQLLADVDGHYPGSSLAAEVSMEAMLAWASGLRAKASHSMPGRAMSSV
jgi:hypothetical protein